MKGGAAMAIDAGPLQGTSPLLKLMALDEQDLAVLSANLQDAVVRISDMAYLPGSRRFALVAARFDWVAAVQGQMERCHTGLHFDRVRSVQRQGLDPAARKTVLNLLSIVFEPAEPPAGTLTLTFSGGAAIRLEVDCLEAQMRDLGTRWKARAQPGHPLDDSPNAQDHTP
jgi:hypothetical protein